MICIPNTTLAVILGKLTYVLGWAGLKLDQTEAASLSEAVTMLKHAMKEPSKESHCPS